MSFYFKGQEGHGNTLVSKAGEVETSRFPWPTLVRKFQANERFCLNSRLFSVHHIHMCMSSFPICIPFIFLSCLITLTKIANVIMKKSGESGYFIVFLTLIGMLWVFLVSMMLATGLSCIDFITLRYVPSIPSLFRAFIKSDVGLCQKPFVSYWNNHVILSLI